MHIDNHETICLIHSPDLTMLNYHDDLLIRTAFNSKLSQHLKPFIKNNENIFTHRTWTTCLINTLKLNKTLITLSNSELLCIHMEWLSDSIPLWYRTHQWKDRLNSSL